MALTSYGYEGSVVELGWSRLHVDAGGSYCVRSATSWQVSVDPSGDRKILVGLGDGAGKGVTDVHATLLDGSLTLASVGSGSRWDMIVARRDWSTNTTTFVVIQGSALKALPARTVGFGTVDDQPIALCRVQSGLTAVQEIIDLRCWKSGGGLFAMDELALGYLTDLGCQVSIKGKTWSYEMNPSYVAAWRLVTPLPGFQRVWSAFRGNPDSWSGNGSMVSVTIPNAPAGDYMIFASASIQLNTGGVTAGVKSIVVNGAVAGLNEQDDIQGNDHGWITKAHSALYRHAGGNLVASYFMVANYSTSVQSGHIYVVHLGATS